MPASSSCPRALSPLRCSASTPERGSSLRSPDAATKIQERLPSPDHCAISHLTHSEGGGPCLTCPCPCPSSFWRLWSRRSSSGSFFRGRQNRRRSSSVGTR